MELNVKENNYKINISYKNDEVLRNYLNNYSKNKYLVITDDVVYDLYKNRLEVIMSGLNYYVFIIPNGENSKSIDAYTDILKYLSDQNFNRSDKIIAFGGGVVGDLSGFVASTYLRGCDYISVPTTLLSMVDSSVGGKTGINFNGLKNQVGSFYFPSYVHIDYSFLETLDRRGINNGLAEIFKYGILSDKELFNYLKEADTLDYEKIIARSLEIKLDYVRDDEKDRGKRQFLNLGHTIGHGIESLSQYQLNHGESVAIGTIQIAKIAENLGIGEKGLVKELIFAFKKHGIPTNFDYNTEDMIKILNHDKKIKNNLINLILPVKVGEVISREFNITELESLLNLGRSNG